MLLYKVINWWYFALPEDSDQLCGEFLEYKNTGNAKISFLENSSVIEISINGGFAPLLSVIDECESCLPTTVTQALWMNEKYFEDSKATLRVEESPYTNNYTIFIGNIEKNELKVLVENQNQLAFILTGTVQGLQNGKIGLHPAGDFLGKCKEAEKKIVAPSAVILTVALSEDGPPLMKFNLSTRAGN